MQPGQIRVFDGLRVTTDHVNHLQRGIHAALEDLRESVGLGRIVRGFDVSIAESNVRVEAGVAFDRRRHALVLSEAAQLSLPQGSKTPKYVFAAYAQVPDGLVEGKPTLIWDECSLTIRDAPPPTDDDALCIAQIVKDGNGTTRVLPMASPPSPVTPASPDGPVAATGTQPVERRFEVAQGLVTFEGLMTTPRSLLGEARRAVATLPQDTASSAAITSPAASPTASAFSAIAARELDTAFLVRSLSLEAQAVLRFRRLQRGADASSSGSEPVLAVAAGSRGEVTCAESWVQHGVTRGLLVSNRVAPDDFAVIGRLERDSIMRVPLGRWMPAATGSDATSSVDKLLASGAICVRARPGDRAQPMLEIGLAAAPELIAGESDAFPVAASVDVLLESFDLTIAWKALGDSTVARSTR